MLRLANEANELLLQKLDRWGEAQPAGEKIIEDFVLRTEKEFGYHIFIDYRTTLKSYQRCVEKVFEYVQNGQANDEVDAVSNWLKDFAGGRVIVTYPMDRKVAVDRFRKYTEVRGASPPKGLLAFGLDGTEEEHN